MRKMCIFFEVSKHIFIAYHTYTTQYFHPPFRFFHDSNIEHSLDITVSEAYYGCVKEVSYKRLVSRFSCDSILKRLCANSYCLIIHFSLSRFLIQLVKWSIVTTVRTKGSFSLKQLRKRRVNIWNNICNRLVLCAWGN